MNLCLVLMGNRQILIQCRVVQTIIFIVFILIKLERSAIKVILVCKFQCIILVCNRRWFTCTFPTKWSRQRTLTVARAFSLCVKVNIFLYQSKQSYVTSSNISYLSVNVSSKSVHRFTGYQTFKLTTFTFLYFIFLHY